jgi:hypothetical protein
MKKSIKAALLSAFVYPGVGHFYLKKNLIGTIFVCAFTLPLYFIILEIIEKAEHIVEKINKGEIPLNVAAISESLSSSTLGGEAQTLTMPIYFLLFIWFIALINSYILGRKQD